MRFTSDDYAVLLGLYLGDGHISATARTQHLRIFLDSRYPTIVRELGDLLDRCLAENSNGRTLFHGGTMTVVDVYSRHLACLLPQHGPGKKHERVIRLEPWQHRLVQAAPWSLLKGLIRSDGCVFVNRTGKYEYLSYDFCNYSSDILDLFAETCDMVGVQYRRQDRRIRINRRASVALMLKHVGVKT